MHGALCVSYSGQCYLSAALSGRSANRGECAQYCRLPYSSVSYTHLDVYKRQIQNRVKLAESRLPAEVIQNGITIEKQAPSQLMTLSLMSDDPKFDEIYLSNFATINVLDVLRRIPGVGRVSNIGSRYYGCLLYTSRCV